MVYILLRKRNEYEFSPDERPMEANEEATGVELHKDSKFFASWQKFKDTNPVVNKFVDYRLVVQCLEGGHSFYLTYSI
jgi:import inner membrane translocase subunit TIM44